MGVSGVALISKELLSRSDVVIEGADAEIVLLTGSKGWSTSGLPLKLELSVHPAVMLRSAVILLRSSQELMTDHHWYGIKSDCMCIGCRY